MEVFPSISHHERAVCRIFTNVGGWWISFVKIQSCWSAGVSEDLCEEHSQWMSNLNQLPTVLTWLSTRHNSVIKLLLFFPRFLDPFLGPWQITWPLTARPLPSVCAMVDVSREGNAKCMAREDWGVRATQSPGLALLHAGCKIWAPDFREEKEAGTTHHPLPALHPLCSLGQGWKWQCARVRAIGAASMQGFSLGTPPCSACITVITKDA